MSDDRSYHMRPNEPTRISTSFDELLKDEPAMPKTPMNWSSVVALIAFFMFVGWIAYLTAYVVTHY